MLTETADTVKRATATTGQCVIEGNHTANLKRHFTEEGRRKQNVPFKLFTSWGQ
jgi:hypothetical protein